jgi:hypothetical protein
LAEKTERDHLETSRHKVLDNIKMDHTEIWWVGVDCSVLKRNALFWAIMQSSGTSYQSNLQSTTLHCVIAHNTAILIYFATEAWQHAWDDPCSGETNCRPLWTWPFEFHKMRGISQLDEELLDFQEWLIWWVIVIIIISSITDSGIYTYSLPLLWQSAVWQTAALPGINLCSCCQVICMIHRSYDLCK